MQAVRLHIAGNGQVWVLARCTCGDVDKHSLASAASGALRCKRCGYKLDLAGAVVEAVEAEVDKASGSRLAVSTSELQDILRLTGLAGGVASINSAVPHRYTAVFLREGSTLRNVALHDKQVARPDLWAPLAVGDSFCSIVLGKREPLQVSEARSDARDEVRQHPAAAKFQAYAGVPLIATNGEVIGALCHFDANPVTDRVDMVAMLQIPRVLRDYLPTASLGGTSDR